MARSFTQLNFAFSSPPHPSPQPYGTQFHSTQLRFVGSASVLKERENAVGSASVLKERRNGLSIFVILSKAEYIKQECYVPSPWGEG